MRAIVIAIAIVLWSPVAGAQSVEERGFIGGQGFLFPQTTPNDTTQVIGDALAREELFVSPARWIQFAGGADLRANSHDQVEDEWRLDVEDRGLLRPRVSLRRLTVTLSGGGFTIALGKQFVRWARTDVLNPIDRFAPRDFLNVIDSEFLAVIGARPSLRIGSETFEAAWVAQLTPSRMPLLDQRWTVLPREAAGVTIHDAGSRFPKRPLYGARWTHTGSRFELGLSYFDGFNHLPGVEVRPLESGADIELTRVFPRLRTYGGDFAIPTGWFTLKGEANYFRSPDDAFAGYGLYVVEIERQAGEWLLSGGYAGEVVKVTEPPLAFDFERQLARSIVGRAAYTVDPRRSVVIEGIVRQNLEGQYVRGEYSQALGGHWRTTFAGVLLTGEEGDFIGQFDRNSHVAITLRFSF